MTEQRSVDQALPKDAVQPVPTRGERVARIVFENGASLAALLIIAIALVASLALLFTEKLSSQGFQLLNTLASGAAGYFFATHKKHD